jgi:hypothetical protein
VEIKVEKNRKAPERSTTPFSKWRATFNNMDSGNWFVVSRENERQRVYSAIFNHKQSGKYSSYIHPDDNTKAVFVKK